MTYIKCKCLRRREDTMFDFLEEARKHNSVSKNWIGGYMAVLNDFRKSKVI